MEKLTNQLEAITGSMFSGKSEELIRRLRRLPYAKQRCIVFKPQLDTRSGSSKIKSKEGGEMQAVDIDISHPDQLMEELAKYEQGIGEKVSVIAVDEAQFFPHGSPVVGILMDLVRQGYRVIVAGLDLDFRAEPFGIMQEVVCLADDVTKLTAVCSQCGSHYARFSQKLWNGRPASRDASQIEVGGQETYEARCIKCFVVPK